SIFVNPSQFGPGEDLAAYPRDLERDAALCASVGVDALFLPEPEQVYPPDFDTWIHPGRAGELACGPWRPGHFRGVLTVVHRLFQWVRPQLSIFGRKDAQQLWLIRRMAEDLGLAHQIEAGPLIRDPDGLAMSSRNIYLSEEERRAALALPRTLQVLARRILDGEEPFAVREELWRGLGELPLL
ncbi:MAG: pantoate--beta-alanine ligase, partial [Candidatus Cloacimonetes bacterium]|nr:pantoate--beta-alanine ligase [Candidatus Cloacimonadota bacterium]